jgi:hypothetical protein
VVFLGTGDRQRPRPLHSPYRRVIQHSLRHRDNLNSQGSNSNWDYGLVLVLFALGLMSKPQFEDLASKRMITWAANRCRSGT